MNAFPTLSKKREPSTRQETKSTAAEAMTAGTQGMKKATAKATDDSKAAMPQNGLFRFVFIGKCFVFPAKILISF